MTKNLKINMLTSKKFQYEKLFTTVLTILGNNVKFLTFLFP